MKAIYVLLLCVAAVALSLAQTEPQADTRPPVIRSIDYKDFKPVTVEQILQRFKAEGLALGVEHRLNADEVSQAQAVLQQLLAENGRPTARVKSEISPIPPRAVKITFTAVNP